MILTGTICFRKGLYDFERIARAMNPRRFRFQLVGSVASEAAKFVSKLPSTVEMIPRQPQSKLPEWYAASDLFMLPTLEDGFAVTLLKPAPAASRSSPRRIARRRILSATGRTAGFSPYAIRTLSSIGCAGVTKIGRK